MSPTAPAAREMRPVSRVERAILNPSPSFPRTRSLGTRTPSRKTIPVSAALRPSFPFRGLVFTPSPRSTRKQVIPLAPFSGSVLAKTRKTSATLAWEMKVFCPSRT